MILLHYKYKNLISATRPFFSDSKRQHYMRFLLNTFPSTLYHLPESKTTGRVQQNYISYKL